MGMHGTARRLFVVTAVVAVGAAPMAPVLPLAPAPPEATAQASDVFVGLVPARLLDTRPGAVTIDGVSAGAGLPPAASTIKLTVVGRGGVPTTGVGAVVLNVTGVNEFGGAGYVTVFPTGSPQPNASTLNVAPGQTVANEIITKVGAGGSIEIYTQSSTHLIADVVGWFPASSDLTPLVPARLLDTRVGAVTIDGQSAGEGLPTAGSTTLLNVVGRGGVPVSGASAVVLNVTAVHSSGGNGYVTVFPTGSPRPNASTLNVAPGQTVANQIVIKVGAGGSVTIFTQASAHLIVDVVGWFPASSHLTALVPARLLDTRSGSTTIDGQAAGAGLPGPGSTTVLTVVGRAGVPASGGVGAVVLNITAVNEVGGDGFITVFPTGSQRPNASTLNVSSGRTVANEVITKVAAGGSVSIYTQASAHLVADVVGWFPGDSVPQTGPLIQAIYAIPSDGSVVAGRDAAIAHEIGEMQVWYDGQTGGEHPVFARTGSAVSVITVHMPQSAASLRADENAESTMEPTIRATPGVPAGASLVIVYEGDTAGGYCGRTGDDIVHIPMATCGIFPTTDSTWPFNMTYLLGHEVTHLLGAVPDCAPHEGAGGHVTDDNRDVLWQGAGSRDWLNLVLDLGHDDYYSANIPGCPGIEANPLLGTG